jgi:hypothetical protein
LFKEAGKEGIREGGRGKKGMREGKKEERNLTGHVIKKVCKKIITISCTIFVPHYFLNKFLYFSLTSWKNLVFILSTAII